MKTNDLKKGDRVIMRGTGWNATVMDNRKGNRRMCEVEGFFTEMGDVYSHDIVYHITEDGDTVPIEHTPAQKKLRKQLVASGWGV